MQGKKIELILAQKFIEKFPHQTKELSKRYSFNILPKISYRTLRYYVTKQLMPKFTIINRKAHYHDKDELHKRLFCIWYLTHFKRATLEEIREILVLKWNAGDSESLLLLLDDKYFIDGILNCSDHEGKINSKELIEHAEDTYLGSQEDRLSSVSKILEYLIRTENEKLEDLLEEFLNKQKRAKEDMAVFKDKPQSYKDKRSYLHDTIKDYKKSLKRFDNRKQQLKNMQSFLRDIEIEINKATKAYKKTLQTIKDLVHNLHPY